VLAAGELDLLRCWAELVFLEHRIQVAGARLRTKPLPESESSVLTRLASVSSTSTRLVLVLQQNVALLRRHACAAAGKAHTEHIEDAVAMGARGSPASPRGSRGQSKKKQGIKRKSIIMQS